MAKPFKLRISRVITSLQSCNSKDTSTLPEDPVPSFLRQSSSPTKLITAVDFPVTAPSNTHRSSSALRRHVSSVLISVGCGLTSRNSGGRSRPQQEFNWRKEENWHVVANIYDETKPRQKIYSSSVSGDDNDEVLALPPPPPPPSTAERKKRRCRKKKTAAAAALRRISTSSADESGLFSNDEEETETLVSSLSTDSSFEFNPKTDHNNRIIRRSKRRPKKRAAKRGTTPTTRRPSVSSSITSSEGEVPARLSVFKKLIPCSVDGKVKESFAVVKKSRDPHEDFKRSMMEMITEKQMFEKDDLEQLLQCFLSLNARQYHGIIVGAFSEIWAELFFAANNVSSSPRMSAFGRRSTPSCS